MSDFHREDFDVPMAEVDGEEEDSNDDEISIDGGDDDGISIDGGDEYGNGQDDDNIVYLEKEMLMILNNDPSLTKLEVGYKEDIEGDHFCYFHPPGNDWLALGKAVGNNSHLQEISVDISSVTTLRLREFVPGLSLNRSIKKMTMTGWDFSVVEVQNNLNRFFNGNHAFESLSVEEIMENMSDMVLTLRSFNSLKEIKFNINFGRTAYCVDNAIEALIGHAGLSKISLCHVRIETRGCALLASLLENLTSLTLSSCTQIDDHGASTLASGIASNTTLTELILGHLGRITAVGWEAIVDALQRSRCRLELLTVRIDWTRMSIDIALFLSRVLLQHKSTLKRLDLVSLPGLECVSRLLRGTDSVLESLSLYQIDDDEITALSDALENNSNTKLKEFHLQSDMITFEAWIALSTVLSFRTSMEKMYLASDSYHSINDDVLISFAEALVNNKVLRELELGNDFSGITSIGYAAFTRLLCNSSSIMSTYQSNHTLMKICERYSLNNNVPEDLRFLLQLNEKNTKSQAARLKIIKTHFSGSEINMHPFMNMDLCVRPHAIAWMVRDENAFHLLRAVPMLLE
jgi:hypothetical protein